MAGKHLGVFTKIRGFIRSILVEDKLVYDEIKPITSDRQIPDWGQIQALIDALADSGLFLRLDGGNVMLANLDVGGNNIVHVGAALDATDKAIFSSIPGRRWLVDKNGNRIADFSDVLKGLGLFLPDASAATFLRPTSTSNEDISLPDLAGAGGMVAMLLNIAYGGVWSGDTKHSPSADVLYNKFAAIDAAIASGSAVAQVFDATTASTFPSGGSGTSKYRVVNSGPNQYYTVQGVDFETEDVIYPKTSTPGPVAADWYVVQANGDYRSKTLADGSIDVGNSANVATPRTPGGAVTMDNVGVFSLVASYVYSAIVTGVATFAGVITNGDSILTMLNKLQTQITNLLTISDPVSPGIDYVTRVETIYNNVKSWATRYFFSDFDMAKQFRSELNVFTKKSVTLAAGNPNLHGSVIVDDYIYFGVRPNSSSSPGRIIKMLLSNISSYTVTTLGGATQNACEVLTYVPQKGKIYIAHNNNANTLYVTEYDPITEVATIVITDISVGYRMYYPAATSDGQYLYVSSGLQTVGATLRVRKYDLITMAFVSELNTGLIGGGHSLKYDGFGNLFLTTTYRTVAIQQYIVQIDVATFTMVTNLPISGESFTDDMARIGNKFYLGAEYVFTSLGTLTVARVESDLSAVDYFTFPSIQATCFGCIYADNALWILADSTPGHIIRVDPETLQASIYTTPTGEGRPNELLWDKKNFYVSFWQDPAVVVMYNKFQFQQNGYMKLVGGNYVYTDYATAYDLSAVALSKMNALVPTAVRVANFTLNANDLAPVDTTSGNLVGTMPNDPDDKSLVAIKHVTQGGTNTITLNTVSPAVFNKSGGATSGTLRLQSECWLAQYDKPNKIWYIIATDAPLAQLDARYLQLAGGQSMTGLFNLFGDAISAMQPVTFQQLQAATVGLWDDRGNFTPSGNYPTTGGSGTGGAILKGDTYLITGLGSGVTALMGTRVVNDGDTVRSLTDIPGQTNANWAVFEANLGFTPENIANKATDFTTVNNILYPSVQAVDNRVSSNEVLTNKISLTSAQILALFTTPRQLVAAPGIGKMIEVLSIFGRLNFNSVAYATNTNLNFYLGSSVLSLASNINLINGTSSRIGKFVFTAISGSTNGNMQENAAVMVNVPGSNPTAGNSTLDLYVTYKIVTL